MFVQAPHSTQRAAISSQISSPSVARMASSSPAAFGISLVLRLEILHDLRAGLVAHLDLRVARLGEEILVLLDELLAAIAERFDEIASLDLRYGQVAALFRPRLRAEQIAEAALAAFAAIGADDEHLVSSDLVERIGEFPFDLHLVDERERGEVAAPRAGDDDLREGLLVGHVVPFGRGIPGDGVAEQLRERLEGLHRPVPVDTQVVGKREELDPFEMQLSGFGLAHGHEELSSGREFLQESLEVGRVYKVHRFVLMTKTTTEAPGPVARFTIALSGLGKRIKQGVIIHERAHVSSPFLNLPEMVLRGAARSFYFFSSRSCMTASLSFSPRTFLKRMIPFLSTRKVAGMELTA